MRRLANYFILIYFFSLVTTQALPSYQFEITTVGATADVPFFKLNNLSTGGEQITQFTITIGDLARNFDGANSEVHNITSFTLNTPDSSFSGGVRDDLIDYSLTGFDSGEFFHFRGDVDPDSFDTGIDFRTVLFNNGAALNSVITVFFSNGQNLSQTLPDGSASLTSYVFNQSSTIPEPSNLVLASLMLGLLAFTQRK